LQAEAQAGVAAIQQITTQTANPGRFAAAYSAVTDTLGDEAWLEGLTYSGNSFSLIGLTQESEKLISVLESSPKISSARFSASVVTDRRHEAERFRIEVQFKGADEAQSMALMEDRG
ncbi:MAG: PilN domain-containing protein, partial [Henriciella sp.]|uniref:PilN domain-containing protein n=1 Tax=Henriciella sp. TaxID=1968823 RepID=UPI003C78711D